MVDRIDVLSMFDYETKGEKKNLAKVGEVAYLIMLWSRNQKCCWPPIQMSSNERGRE